MANARDILIIDDDRDLVGVMRTVLESMAYRVRTAHDGRQGLARIEAETPDLIILDVMMATETEGFDLAYQLRDHSAYRHIPILMVTSFPRKMAAEGPEKFQHILGESWPVSQFLEKPVDPEVLLSTVEALLREGA